MHERIERWVGIALLLLPCLAWAGPDVRVINTSAEPVPVTGNVHVTNTPTVAISPSTVLATRSVDEPARSAFQLSRTIMIPPGSPFIETEMTPIPVGKRLVVELVSIEAELPIGQKLLFAGFDPFLGTPPAPGTQSHVYVPAQFTATVGSFDIYAACLKTLFYADASSAPIGSGFTGLQIFASRSESAGSAQVTFTVSGHLLDCGPATCSP